MTFAGNDDLDWEFALVRTLGIRLVHLGGRTWRQESSRLAGAASRCGRNRCRSQRDPGCGSDRDQEPVRSFETFTRDLNSLADWLQACGIRSVAIESTSVYWIPLHQILESRGIQVYLVNAQYVKNVPGRKSDV